MPRAACPPVRNCGGLTGRQAARATDSMRTDRPLVAALIFAVIFSRLAFLHLLPGASARVKAIRLDTSLSAVIRELLERWLTGELKIRQEEEQEES